MKSARLNNWAMTAKGGERYVYHVGVSAQDRDVKIRVCEAAWLLYGQGEIALFQRRVRAADGVFQYIAVKLGSLEARAAFGYPKPSEGVFVRRGRERGAFVLKGARP